MTMDLMMFALIFSICREESADQSQSANPQVQGERQVRVTGTVIIKSESRFMMFMILSGLHSVVIWSLI